MKEEITIEEKLALRKKQWEMAMAGDVRMLIHLGKQYLGQTDNPPRQFNNPISGVTFVDDLINDDGDIDL
jgi:hypothetical protein